jgi:hypothetical protein
VGGRELEGEALRARLMGRKEEKREGWDVASGADGWWITSSGGGEARRASLEMLIGGVEGPVRCWR